MSYELVKAQFDKLDAIVEEAAKALRGFPKGDMNITLDAIKFSPEYVAKVRVYREAFSQRGECARYLLRHHRKQYQADRIQERDERRKAKV
jgi:hypothetical protein